MKTILVYQDAKREETVFALREALDAVGLNFSTFARKYGYDPRFVNLTAWLHWDTGKLPRGLKMRRIIKALEQEVASATPSTSLDT